MVDILRVSEGREYSRLPFECTRPYAASRRSSISSRAESEASVFSDAASIASSQSSVSVRTSSGWDSSAQFDSDEDANSTSCDETSELDSVPNSAKPVHLNLFSALKAAAGPECHAKPSGAVGKKQLPRKTTASDTDELKNLLSRVSVRRDVSAPTVGPAASGTAAEKDANCPFVRPLHPSQTGGHRAHPVPSHPRRTVTDPNWTKPSLVSQDERRLNFVENLVDTATALVALIWPASVNPVFPDGQRHGTPVISLRFFIRETLRRSRTSFSTLQVAMYYLALLNVSGKVPKCEPTKGQQTDNMSRRALQCGRRMFLASLILASKYLQDRNYFTKAWSRISNLSVAEINRNEMALLSALDYKLHIKTVEFQRWTDCISKCTIAVQRGAQCPWREGLAYLNLWHGAADIVPAGGLYTNRSLRPAALDNCDIPIGNGVATPTRASTLPAHRLNLLRAGQSVCPTRPRPCIPMHGDLQWPGMATHLSSATRTMSQFSASPEPLGETESRGSQQPNQGGAGVLLSPPKTPSPRAEDVEMRDEDSELRSTMQGAGLTPPPAPREPLVSLNTTPESNDGASTFGNYLGPINTASDAPETRDEGRRLPQLAHGSAARFPADTLNHHGAEAAGDNALPELDSPSSSPSADSFDLPSPTLELVQFVRPQEEDSDFKHPALDATDADFNLSQQNTMVVPDESVAAVRPDVETATRRLMRKDLGVDAVDAHSFATHSSASPTVETFTESVNSTPAEDGVCQRALKKCRSQKQAHCHRKKRGPSCFSSELADRTSKAMRV